MSNKIIDSDKNTSHIYVNGPTNCVRMEGNINGIKKVVYIFMDFHLSHSECDNIDSLEFKQYFVKTAKALKEKVDFFFETNPHATNLFTSKKNYKTFRDRYFDSVHKLFASEFKIDENNKITSSRIFKNIRFHYTDVRLPFSFQTDTQIEWLVDFCRNHLYYLELTTADCDEFYKKMTECKNFITMMYEFLNNPDEIYDKIKNASPHAIIEYKIFKKIQDKYKNDNVKLIVKNIISSYIKSHYEKLMDLFTKAFDDLKSIKKKIIGPDALNDTFSDTVGIGDDSRFFIESLSLLYTTVMTIDIRSTRLYSRFMDIYFIRRLCDKDYIKNSVVYTGASHSAFYIYILSKYFDFNITHYSYSSLNDIDEINKTIQKSSSYIEIEKIFYQPELLQCTNMTSFPKNFE